MQQIYEDNIQNVKFIDLGNNNNKFSARFCNSPLHDFPRISLPPSGNEHILLHGIGR